MIKRINYIKNFGVFQNYKRNGDIQDFENVNIFYGWNYSGKTTISRIFQQFESGERNTDYSNAEFEIEDYNGKKYTEQNLELENRSIRTFNADFIRENLKWDGSSFNAIQVLTLGKEAIEAEKKIKEKESKLSRIEEIGKRLGSELDSINNLIQSGLTDTASNIKSTLQLVSTFTKTHIRPIFDSLKSNYSENILKETEIKKLIPTATAAESQKLPVLGEVEIPPKIDEYFEKVKTLLKQVPEFSKTIDYFIKNPNIANWVESGIPLHSEKRICEFCGNPISEERLSDLLAHFSEDLKRHKKLLDDLISELEEIKLSEPPFSKRDFYQDYWEEFEKVQLTIKGEVIKSYNKKISKLIVFLKEKHNKPFEPIVDFKDFDSSVVNLVESYTSYNSIIKKNNVKTKDFDKAKNDAIETLKKHFIAKFISDIELEQKENKVSIYEKRKENLGLTYRSIKTDINSLEAQISQAQKGREKINEFIKKFLGRDEIKVEVIKEEEKERFTLKRGALKAKNLSEGEKTAIAFSFFLTKLLEIKDFDKTLVCIDDPISSLDSNHVFQVNAIIKDFFYNKNDDNSPWTLKCEQLFLSTHNFDFFNLLRELPSGSQIKCFYYQVRRINDKESILEKLPKSLQHYTSEYHFLFEELYKFHNSDNKSEYSTLIGIPNAVRRFVELYTYSRLPTNRNISVDQRADELWGIEKSKRILKVLNYFSHSNSIDRISRNSDLICDIENAVNDLMIELKKDDKHYKELLKSIN